VLARISLVFARRKIIVSIMVAALTQKTGAWNEHLTFNWFDLAVLAVLAFGFWRGRKRGMTKELFPTLQWVAILLGAGLGHIPLAAWLHQQGLVNKVFGAHLDEHTAALMSAYLCILFVVCVIFSTLKRRWEPKLEGSNCFGGNEYYWGVVAGLVRYAALMLVALALLNGPYYSPSEIQAIKQYKLNTFAGGGNVKGLENDTGDFIPSVYEVQDSVFKKSFVGPLIKSKLSILLINSGGPAAKTAHS
jgi:magnesium-transporting ATPase (P-type)